MTIKFPDALKSEPLVRSVELQDTLLVRVAQELMSQAMYAGSFSNTRHSLEEPI